MMFEENAWLKKSVVKAIVLMVFFSVLVAVLNLVPDVIGFIGNIIAIFDGYFTIAIVSHIIAVLISAIDIAEKVLFLGLGVKALSQGTIAIPFIDTQVSKYMD